MSLKYEPAPSGCVISKSVISYISWDLLTPVISKSVISYISWDLITPVIRLITFRADNISARALGKLL